MRLFKNQSLLRQMSQYQKCSKLKNKNLIGNFSGHQNGSKSLYLTLKVPKWGYF